MRVCEMQSTSWTITWGNPTFLTDSYRGISLQDAFDSYYQLRKENTSYWLEVHRRFVREIIPQLGASTPVTAITKSDVRELVNKRLREGHKIAARKLFDVLYPFFTFCVSEDYTPVHPMATLVRPKPSKPRDRVLTLDEVKLIWWASDELEYPFGPFVKLLFLTAQRRNEVAGMAWDEIDLAKQLWTIPKERIKNDKAHIVHLSQLALDVLTPLKRLSPFVFTTTRVSPISGFSRAKAQLDELSGVRDWRFHDIRRTVVTFMAELGIPTDIADRILNHVSESRSGVKGIYQRYEFINERKDALDKWSEFLASNVSRCF